MSSRARALAASNRILHRVGLELGRYPRNDDAHAIRQRLLATSNVDLVIDVGANAGQYGRCLRKAGYTGRIVSLEPLSSPFGKLRVASRPDPAWMAIQTAAGTAEGEATVNIAASDVASSTLPLHKGAEAMIGFGYVAQERVRVASIDTLVGDMLGNQSFLKIDVQGTERSVLEGAARTLGHLAGIELELSFAPLYQGQTLWREDIDYLERKGFHLVNLTPGFRDRVTGDLLQADGLFVRGDGASRGFRRDG